MTGPDRGTTFRASLGLGTWARRSGGDRTESEDEVPGESRVGDARTSGIESGEEVPGESRTGDVG